MNDDDLIGLVCPWCSTEVFAAKVDEAIHIKPSRPVTGNLNVCYACFAPSITRVDDNGVVTLRRPTPLEWVKIANTPYLPQLYEVLAGIVEEHNSQITGDDVTPGDVGEPYECDACHRTFIRSVNDAVPLGEAREQYGPDEPLGIICDDCHDRLQRWIANGGITARGEVRNEPPPE